MGNYCFKKQIKIIRGLPLILLEKKGKNDTIISTKIVEDVYVEDTKWKRGFQDWNWNLDN